MSEQAVDLRSTWSRAPAAQPPAPRRRGCRCAGRAGPALPLPPPYSSTSEVLLPSATQGGSGRTGGYEADTQVIIATSAEILTRAGKEMQPELSPEEMERPRRGGGPDGVDPADHGRGPHERPGRGSRLRRRRVARRVPRGLVTVPSRVLGGRPSSSASTRSRRASTPSTRRSGRPPSGSPTRVGPQPPAGCDAAALSDLTAVRASTVLDIDALKNQLAGGGHHLRPGRCRSERHPARQPGHTERASSPMH